MSNSYDWENKWEIYKKVHYMNFQEKEVALQRVANKMIVT